MDEVESTIGAVLENSDVQTHLEPQGQRCPYDTEAVQGSRAPDGV